MSLSKIWSKLCRRSLSSPSDKKPILSDLTLHMRSTLWPIAAVTLLGGVLFVGYSSSNVASAAGPQGHYAVGAGSLNARERTFAPQSPIEATADAEVVRARAKLDVGQTYPLPNLERVELTVSARGSPELRSLPRFNTRFNNKIAGLSARDEYIFYTLNSELQEFAERMVSGARAPHVAVVAMDPRTGRILAIAGKSKTIKDIPLHAKFPAASLFKLVTTTAALEKSPIGPLTPVAYRGGNYTLNRWNYLPNPKSDRRKMSLAEALGKSCNPVFARVALRYLNSGIIRQYAQLFGFNKNLGFDSALTTSVAAIPENDPYELGRTAAGFGEVKLSPIHAAVLVSGIANNGILPRPMLIDKVVDRRGTVLYRASPEMLNNVMQPVTARTLLKMMEFTTTIGTSRNEFVNKHRKVLGPIDVAAKTGTLNGSDPEGINHWFVAAAPIQNPQIAVAIIVVDPPRRGAKAAHLGKQMIEQYLNRPQKVLATPRIAGAAGAPRFARR